MADRNARQRLQLLMAVAAARCTAATPLPPRTFGSGLLLSICEAPTSLLVHNISAGLGLVTHFWSTGDVDTNVLVEYFIDGEALPGIAFEPAMACGQGWPGDMNADPVSPGGIYSAGDKMGKGAATGGWYFKYRVPFQQSFRAQARLIRPKPGGGCQAAYMILRGHEVGAGERGLVLPSGYELPLTARLQLQRIDKATFPALSLVALANVSAGYSAVLLQTTMALSTHPPANNYIEGCFHLLRRASESYPGLIVGTGFEDYFNSAYCEVELLSGKMIQKSPVHRFVLLLIPSPTRRVRRRERRARQPLPARGLWGTALLPWYAGRRGWLRAPQRVPLSRWGGHWYGGRRAAGVARGG